MFTYCNCSSVRCCFNAGCISTVLLASGPVDTVLAVVPGFLGDLGVVEGNVPPAVHTAFSGVCPHGLSLAMLCINNN